MILTKKNITNIRELVIHPDRIIKNVLWRFPQKKSKLRHIFIVGCPRSGTSLVKLILDAHNNLSSPGFETGIFLFKDIYSFRDELSHLLPSSEAIERLINQSVDIIDFFDNLSIELLKEYGGTRFVEKTPSNVLRLKFLIKYFPNAQFINVIRDGRDCYCSSLIHSNVIQNNDIKTYAQYWRRCINSRLSLREASNVFDLRYEELVSEPEKVLISMMSFLSEEFDQKQLEPHLYSRNPKKNNTQAFKKLSQPIDSSSISRYQKDLSDHEIAQFNQIAKKELLLLGYKL